MVRGEERIASGNAPTASGNRTHYAAISALQLRAVEHSGLT
jgi:hypothetical protein